MNESWKSLSWRGIGIVLLTMLVYLPALRGGFVWDDHNNITDNRLLGTLEGLKRTWLDPQASFQYYPLTYTGFWVEHQIWGLRPAGYHVVNVLLHAMNAFLVGLVLTRLAVPGAWVAAVLFAVHPVHVESVAWITELKNVLSEFFCLGSFLAFLRFRQRAEYRWWFYGGAFLLFVCALFAKTAVVALPGAILLVLWWKQERVGRREIVQLVPFFLVGVALALLTVSLEKHSVGAEGPEWRLSLVERCLVAGRVVWFSAGKLFWPHPLMFIYPRWQIDAGRWWQYLFVAGVVAVVVILWLLRKRVGKGPLAGVLFFVGTTAPVPAFINLYFTRFSFVADHFQYLGSLGLIALAGAVASGVLTGRKLRYAAVLAVVIVLGALSWRHCKTFGDEETLWRNTLAYNPDAWLAHNNLGVALSSQNRMAEETVEYLAALRIKPDYAEAHYNLGRIFTRQGEAAKAMAEYKLALQFQPAYVKAHADLGILLAGLGKTPEAIAEYEAALKIDPNAAGVHNNLGILLARLGKAEEAIAEYQTALRIDPGCAEAHNNLGNVLFGRGKFTEAAGEYREAVRINPNYVEAHSSLGLVLAGLGRAEEAVAEYRETLRVNPNYVEARNNLGLVLAGLGKTEEAMAEYREALRVNPGYAEAHCNVGGLLAMQGKTEEAIAQYREAARLRPDWPRPLGKLAWLLATVESAGVRNGGEAVQLAERLCELTGQRQAEAVMVLAAAYAEAGRFAEAIQTAQKAIELARKNGQQEMAVRIEEQRKLYQGGRPFHERSAPVSSSQ